MRKYVKVPFNSGSKGLDRLVKQTQAIPGQRIGTGMVLAGAPQQGALNSALGFIERIQKLSPDSPGGERIPEALKVCWGTYSWLQQWVMKNSVVAKDPGKFSTVSYDDYLSIVKAYEDEDDD